MIILNYYLANFLVLNFLCLLRLFPCLMMIDKNQKQKIGLRLC